MRGVCHFCNSGTNPLTSPLIRTSGLAGAIAREPGAGQSLALQSAIFNLDRWPATRSFVAIKIGECPLRRKELIALHFPTGIITLKPQPPCATDLHRQTHTPDVGHRFMPVRCGPHGLGSQHFHPLDQRNRLVQATTGKDDLNLGFRADNALNNQVTATAAVHDRNELDHNIAHLALEQPGILDQRCDF